MCHSNSRPAIASVVTLTGRSTGDFPKLLLREGKSTKTVIERLQRDELLAGRRPSARDSLSGCPRCHRRARGFPSCRLPTACYRPPLFSACISMRPRRVRLCEITLRFARSRARSNRLSPVQRPPGRNATVPDLPRSVQLQKDIAFFHRLARFETRSRLTIPANLRADQWRPAPARSNRLRSSIGCQSALLDFRARHRRRRRNHHFAGGDHGENLHHLDPGKQEKHCR